MRRFLFLLPFLILLIVVLVVFLRGSRIARNSSISPTPSSLGRQVETDDDLEKLFANLDEAEAIVSSTSTLSLTSPDDLQIAASETRIAAAKMAALCIDNTHLKTFAKRLTTVQRDLEEQNSIVAIRRLASIIEGIATTTPDSVAMLVEPTRALTRIFVGRAVDPLSVTSRPSALAQLSATIESSAIPEKKKRILLRFVGAAIAADLANDTAGVLNAIGKVVRAAAILRTQRTPAISAELAATIVSNAAGIMTYFDANALVTQLRGGIKTGNLEYALGAVLSTRRERMRSDINALISSQPQNIDSLLPSNLTPTFSRGLYREYRATSAPGDPPIIFQVDCDGTWRISDL